MASSDENPGAMPPGDGSVPPGKPMTVGQHIIDKGAQMMQSLKPIKKMSQHVCTFAIYSHDMTRQIHTHHYVTRLNQDFLQCAVYDSDDSSARLIGVEYIISGGIFEGLSPEEQKLWHSHAHEIKSGLWVNPRVPEMVVRPELENLAKTYGKFWCTWQTDRGDKLPMGPPALMMSPQELDLGIVKLDLVKKRDDKYNISTEALKTARAELAVPEAERINPQADYWKQHGKGFAIEVESTEMKKITAFP
ncbi:UNVERIFIED_CONTAM: Oil body-associated protein 2A [Sesamum radiatum]|uniref:Oil body-associated protein 2A n=1 Tax=Sesamum radiatum TaxID=300843 RepID=A0AAW2KGY7_SESRA